LLDAVHHLDESTSSWSPFLLPAGDLRPDAGSGESALLVRCFEWSPAGKAARFIGEAVVAKQAFAQAQDLDLPLVNTMEKAKDPHHYTNSGQLSLTVETVTRHDLNPH
jgi:hypothetical protein